MNDQDLRDCFAMFAMMGFVNNGAKLDRDVSETLIAGWSYDMADAMLEARKPQETVGLPAIKKRTKK